MKRSEDLISNLPRDIIETILEHLTLAEAVKTSILSKKWRYNWTTITRLIFDYGFLEYIINNESLVNIGFKNIINSVFRLYRGQRLTFSLVLPPSCFFEDSTDFDKWMLLLSKKDLKELILINENHPIKLSSHMFSGKDLRVLHLCNFVLEPRSPHAFICFKNLIDIRFENVVIAKDVFETIISNALQLQILHVSDCKGLDQLNVHAPKLKTMHVSGNFKTIYIGSMVDLETVTFSFRKLDNFPCHGLSIASWFQLKNLFLWFDALQVFAAVVATKLLPTKLYHLKCLTLANIKFRTPDMFQYAVCLIKSSPNLQKLIYSCPTYEDWVIEPITKWMEGQDWADCSFAHLRTVKMKWINCISPELLLLKGLLRISPVLEIISIRHSPSPHVAKDDAVKFNAALEQYHQASPRAMIICKPIWSLH